MRSAEETPCPACNDEDGLEMRSITHEMPHVGEVVETVLDCDNCGFRSTTTMIAEQDEAVRYELEVAGDGLTARVVRSTSCTVRVPDLGIDIEPAHASDAYITNVEGVLKRIERVLGHVRRTEDGDEADKADELLTKLQRMIDGDRSFTLILEDPFGNSAIVHDDVASRPLSDEEVDQLRTGQTTFKRD